MYKILITILLFSAFMFFVGTYHTGMLLNSLRFIFDYVLVPFATWLQSLNFLQFISFVVFIAVACLTGIMLLEDRDRRKEQLQSEVE